MKEEIIKNIMEIFLDSIRDYEHEAGHSIHSDDRDSSFFVEQFCEKDDWFKDELAKLQSQESESVSRDKVYEWLQDLNRDYISPETAMENIDSWIDEQLKLSANNEQTAIEIQKIFHEKKYKTYFEETKAIEAILNKQASQIEESPKDEFERISKNYQDATKYLEDNEVDIQEETELAKEHIDKIKEHLKPKQIEISDEGSKCPHCGKEVNYLNHKLSPFLVGI